MNATHDGSDRRPLAEEAGAVIKRGRIHPTRLRRALGLPVVSSEKPSIYIVYAGQKV
jgi:hypothetical protein